MSEVPVTEWAASGEPQVRRAPSFDAVYAAELPRLVALARGLCGVELAEDVAQEAMLAAYRRWPDVAGLDRRTCGCVRPAPTSRSHSSAGAWSSCAP